MDILVLWKANLRRKKGTAPSIALLTMLVVAMTAATISARVHFQQAAERAFALADGGDITLYIETQLLTEELRESVEKHELVERAAYYDIIAGENATVGDVTDGNDWFLMELRDGILLYNEKVNGFEEETLEPKRGEIYLPLGLRSKMKCGVGDTLTIQRADREYTFTIRGFVQEPISGAENIGFKQVFINGDDFGRMQADSAADPDMGNVECKLMMIYRAKDCGLTDMKFQRQLNLDTKIITNAYGALTKQQSINYTGLLQEIFSYVLVVFGGFMFVIVLIVMSRSISSEIETDYVNLGILKAQGFTKGKICAVIALQYLSAELLGVLLGGLLALPLERWLGLALVENTGILPESGLCMGKSLAIMAAVLLFSVATIVLKTGKIAKISPIRAIRGGKEEIYFDSRLHMPITKRALSLTLSLRQFTSSGRRYAGTILIAAILMFFLLSVEMIGNLMSSRSALSAMGMEVCDLEVTWKDENRRGEKAEEIETLVESFSGIQKKYYEFAGYMSVNGENLRGSCYQYPEYIHPILKGRAPLYDNEIVITELVADTLGVQMGEEVTVARKDKEARYLVSGIYQSGIDVGMTFALSMEGAKKLGIEHLSYMDFVLEDPSANEEVVAALNERFGDLIEANAFRLDSILGDTVLQAVQALQMLVYVLSVLFILLVVRMVCAKNFAQERTDLGIYKAMGFTAGRLRLQFAFRFLAASVIGAALGMCLSVCFSAPLLGFFLRSIGLAIVSTDYTAGTVLLPILVMGVCFFAFAWLSAGRVKRVEVRELIVE